MNNLETIPKELKLDISILTGSGACLRKFFALYFAASEGGGDYKTHYGSAGHHGLEAWYKGESFPNSLQAACKTYDSIDLSIPKDDFRTREHLINTITTYTCLEYPDRNQDQYAPISINGHPAVELKGTIPFKSYTLPNRLDENGKPRRVAVNFYFTIDTVGRSLIDKGLIGIDHKFSAMWKKNFEKSFIFSPQAAFYSWMMKEYLGLRYFPEFHFNGVLIRKATKENTAPFESCRIGPIEYTAARMLEFQGWIEQKVEWIIDALDKNLWKPDFNTCDGKYNHCFLKNICEAGEEEYMSSLNQLEDRKTYAPEKHR